MAITRKQQAAREALFRAITRCREQDVAQALEDARGWAGVHCLAGLPSLHLAAALRCPPVVRMLVAAGAPVNAFLSVSLSNILRDAPWLYIGSVEQRLALDTPGHTALAVACSVAHPPTVEALLELGADPNLAGTRQLWQLKPHLPLQCAVHRNFAGEMDAAKRRVVDLLLAAGADPLVRTGSPLGSPLLLAYNCNSSALEAMLAHLEQRRAAGQLVLPSGAAATDLMRAAARKGCLPLFSVAHEYVLAACGLRWKQQGADAAEAGTAAGERHAGRRSRDSDGSSSSSSSDDGDGRFEGGMHPQPGVVAGHLAEGAAQLPQPRAPAWQPTAAELSDTLRCAVLGGCAATLRGILASPLPFPLSATDAERNGLLALCALDRGSAPAFAALHAAGARLSLPRLLHLLDRSVHPERLAWLLALQRPAVSQAVVLSSPYLRWACPVHYLLSLWKDEQRLSERDAMALLEVLVAAGYRPTVWHSLPHGVRVKNGLYLPAGARCDPFAYWRDTRRTSGAERRLRLVAQGGSWSTEAHRLWPEAFKAATRTLLLANRARHEAAWADSGALRRGSNRLPPGADLASLPPDLLPSVISAAAWPMSAWL